MGKLVGPLRPSIGFHGAGPAQAGVRQALGQDR